MRVVVDTNVVIDAFASREPWNTAAENIFPLVSGGKLEAFICASSVTDIYYICNKSLKDQTKARQVIQTLLNLFAVANVRKKDLQDTFNLKVDDFEDALVALVRKEQMPNTSLPEIRMTSSIHPYQPLHRRSF